MNRRSVGRATNNGRVRIVAAPGWFAPGRSPARTGHLYQGRFKAFPIENDEYLLKVLRSVERNPLRANLVKEAEAWPWSSLWFRRYDANVAARLCGWPKAMPED